MEGKNENIFNQKEMLKFFPWIKRIHQEFAKSFPGYYSAEALEFFRKEIEAEIQNFSLLQSTERQKALFQFLSDFYNHFRWKIRFGKKHSSHMEDFCMKLLSSLIKVGIILSGRDLKSSWFNRILFAVEIFPCGNDLLYTALLSLTSLKKINQESYGAVLKHVLCREPQNVIGVDVYFKLMLLFRRLKLLLKDGFEKTQVIWSAKLVKAPVETTSWLYSHNLETLAGIATKSIPKHILSNKLSKEDLLQLREILLPGTFSEMTKIAKPKKHSKLKSDYFFIDNESGQSALLCQKDKTECVSPPCKKRRKIKTLNSFDSESQVLGLRDNKSASLETVTEKCSISSNKMLAKKNKEQTFNRFHPSQSKPCTPLNFIQSPSPKRKNKKDKHPINDVTDTPKLKNLELSDSITATEKSPICIKRLKKSGKSTFKVLQPIESKAHSFLDTNQNPYYKKKEKSKSLSNVVTDIPEKSKDVLEICNKTLKPTSHTLSKSKKLNDLEHRDSIPVLTPIETPTEKCENNKRLKKKSKKSTIKDFQPSESNTHSSLDDIQYPSLKRKKQKTKLPLDGSNGVTDIPEISNDLLLIRQKPLDDLSDKKTPQNDERIMFIEDDNLNHECEESTFVTSFESKKLNNFKQMNSIAVLASVETAAEKCSVLNNKNIEEKSDKSTSKGFQPSESKACSSPDANQYLPSKERKNKKTEKQIDIYNEISDIPEKSSLLVKKEPMDDLSLLKTLENNQRIKIIESNIENDELDCRCEESINISPESTKKVDDFEHINVHPFSHLEVSKSKAKDLNNDMGMTVCEKSILMENDSDINNLVSENAASDFQNNYNQDIPSDNTDNSFIFEKDNLKSTCDSQTMEVIKPSIELIHNTEICVRIDEISTPEVSIRELEDSPKYSDELSPVECSNNFSIKTDNEDNSLQNGVEVRIDEVSMSREITKELKNIPNYSDESAPVEDVEVSSNNFPVETGNEKNSLQKESLSKSVVVHNHDECTIEIQDLASQINDKLEDAKDIESASDWSLISESEELNETSDDLSQKPEITFSNLNVDCVDEIVLVKSSDFGSEKLSEVAKDDCKDLQQNKTFSKSDDLQISSSNIINGCNQYYDIDKQMTAEVPEAERNSKYIPKNQQLYNESSDLSLLCKSEDVCNVLELPSLREAGKESKREILANNQWLEDNESTDTESNKDYNYSKVKQCLEEKSMDSIEIDDCTNEICNVKSKTFQATTSLATGFDGAEGFAKPESPTFEDQNSLVKGIFANVELQELKNVHLFKKEKLVSDGVLEQGDGGWTQDKSVETSVIMGDEETHPSVIIDKSIVVEKHATIKVEKHEEKVLISNAPEYYETQSIDESSKPVAVSSKSSSNGETLEMDKINVPVSSFKEEPGQETYNIPIDNAVKYIVQKMLMKKMREEEALEDSALDDIIINTGISLAPDELESTGFATKEKYCSFSDVCIDDPFEDTESAKQVSDHSNVKSLEFLLYRISKSPDGRSESNFSETLNDDTLVESTGLSDRSTSIDSEEDICYSASDSRTEEMDSEDVEFFANSTLSPKIPDLVKSTSDEKTLQLKLDSSDFLNVTPKTPDLVKKTYDEKFLPELGDSDLNIEKPIQSFKIGSEELNVLLQSKSEVVIGNRCDIRVVCDDFKTSKSIPESERKVLINKKNAVESIFSSEYPFVQDNFENLSVLVDDCQTSVNGAKASEQESGIVTRRSKRKRDAKCYEDSITKVTVEKAWDVLSETSQNCLNEVEETYENESVTHRSRKTNVTGNSDDSVCEISGVKETKRLSGSSQRSLDAIEEAEDYGIVTQSRINAEEWVVLSESSSNSLNGEETTYESATHMSRRTRSTGYSDDFVSEISGEKERKKLSGSSQSSLDAIEEAEDYGIVTQRSRIKAVEEFDALSESSQNSLNGEETTYESATHTSRRTRSTGYSDDSVSEISGEKEGKKLSGSSQRSLDAIEEAEDYGIVTQRSRIKAVEEFDALSESSQNSMNGEEETYENGSSTHRTRKKRGTEYVGEISGGKEKKILENSPSSMDVIEDAEKWGIVTRRRKKNTECSGNSAVEVDSEKVLDFTENRENSLDEMEKAEHTRVTRSKKITNTDSSEGLEKQSNALPESSQYSLDMKNETEGNGIAVRSSNRRKKDTKTTKKGQSGKEVLNSKGIKSSKSMILSYFTREDSKNISNTKNDIDTQKQESHPSEEMHASRPNTRKHLAPSSYKSKIATDETQTLKKQPVKRSTRKKHDPDGDTCSNASSSYFLRCCTRNKAFNSNVNLDFDFNQLSLNSPQAKSKQDTSVETHLECTTEDIETVSNYSTESTKENSKSKITTRSAAATVNKDSSKENATDSKSAGYGLRPKRLIRPSKLNV